MRSTLESEGAREGTAWSRRGVMGLLGGAAVAAPLRAFGQEEAPGDKALAKASPQVRGFYEAHKAVSWSRANTQALERALADADRHALDPAAFTSLLKTRGGSDLAKTRAALAYAGVLAKGLANPADLFDIYTVPRPGLNVGKGLAGAMASGDLSSWFSGLPPQTDEYGALGAAFLKARAAAQAGPASPKIAKGGSVAEGDDDPRVPLIVRRLREAGCAPAPDNPDAAAQPQRFTPAVAAALRAFQHARGLKEDGVFGPHSRALLNDGPAEHAVALALALERRRWLERSPPAERIDVNTAACTLAYLRDGAVQHRARVVCGRSGHETPELQASFKRLVINPPWRVPSSIAQAEIIPKGPGYLRRHHMHWKNGLIEQSPGPWAALGEVKFDMRDPYAIYLHDTPSKDLFAHSQRHLSHGCVRVEDAVGFARSLAATYDATADFDSRLATGDTHTLPLPRAIPVRLLYHTTFAGDDGEVRYRSDVYGWDAQLATALGLSGEPEDRGEAPEVRPLGP